MDSVCKELSPSSLHVEVVFRCWGRSYDDSTGDVCGEGRGQSVMRLSWVNPSPSSDSYVLTCHPSFCPSMWCNTHESPTVKVEEGRGESKLIYNAGTPSHISSISQNQIVYHRSPHPKIWGLEKNRMTAQAVPFPLRHSYQDFKILRLFGLPQKSFWMFLTPNTAAFPLVQK